MHQLTLLPTRSSFGPDDPIEIEIESEPENGPHEFVGQLTVWHLGEQVATVTVTAPGVQTLPELDDGSYGVELEIDGRLVARTAIEVTEDQRARLRYGFVASYAPDKDVDAAARLARRLHLNGIQFYDWAYRHADLVGGGEQYDDALDQPISLDTVRDLVAAYRAVGTDSIGYAAVYAVGPNEWTQWESHALLRPTGEPYALGDFLFIVDPAAPEWVAHFRADLARATAAVGFDGYHLDQYGYPKFASTPDEAVVDVAESFALLIDQVRDELPEARLIFNNVNDFPTWRTAALPQDAVYIEPWVPNDTLGSLAELARRARASSAGQPIVLAAYQHIYDSEPAEDADRAAALTMATVFSHGATQLLVGEEGRLLVDPYYVRNHPAEADTLAFLTRWYDFVVEHDAILMPPAISEVTSSYVGAYNGDLDVTYAHASVSSAPEADSVWRRVTSTDQGLVVHLINLCGQTDTLWDAGRAPVTSPGSAELRFRHVRGRVPQVRVADPDGAARLVAVTVRFDGDDAVVELPPLKIWQVVHVVF
ncbi:glycoside hydrolase family 66 protein [Herbiconiux sp. P16]|uniref:glycoside hydrolase family 66 protein n=1 Tax=Herbiconiux wuyangfengii TaxID=3342794 RepID=UPI0035B87A53